jgi:TolB-like protein
MGSRLLLYVALFTCLGARATSQEFLDLDSALTKLSSDLIQAVENDQKHRIAVMRFADITDYSTPNEGQSNLGLLVSEELTIRFANSTKFSVVERVLLDKLFAEARMVEEGFIDEETAQKMGKLLGVDAICSGTFMILGDHIRFNARVISARTGLLLAAASAKVKRDEGSSFRQSQENLIESLKRRAKSN